MEEFWQFPDIDKNCSNLCVSANAKSSTNSDPTTCVDIASFHEEWGELDEKHCINDAHSRTKIYKMCRKEKKDNVDDNCIVKMYQLPNKIFSRKSYDFDVIRIKKTYKLFRGIMNFDKIYYDSKREQLLISMEELQQTMREYVDKYSKTKISEIECQFTIYSLLQTISILHCRGYLHCDLKPENIMWRDNNMHKRPDINGWIIIDYDNRYFIGRKQYIKSKTIRGTMSWTAPELRPITGIFEKASKKDKHFNYFYRGTDIWPLGLIILYMLFGKQPYELSEYERYTINDYQHHFYYTKLLKGGKYDIDSDNNCGEIWLRNYLVSLYVKEKISKNLFDLLHNKILVFDPRKRANCKEIWHHQWFDEYRNLCLQNKDKKQYIISL